VRLTGSRQPILSFSIPDLEPDPVAEKRANFDRIGDRVGELQGELQDRREAIATESTQTVEHAAATIVAGGTVKAPARSARLDAEAALAQLEQEKKTLELAGDIAGNDFADAIGASKDEWLPVREQAAADAAKRLDAAIRDAEEAAKDLGYARAAAEWVSTFLASDAKVGRQSQFVPGKLLVTGKGALRGQHNVLDLLKLCAQAVHQDEKQFSLKASVR
jgi:hypothetical protein